MGRRKTNRKSKRVSFPEGLDAGELRQGNAMIGLSMPTPGRPPIGSVYVDDEILRVLVQKSQTLFGACYAVFADSLQWSNVRLWHLLSRSEESAVPTEEQCRMEAEGIGDSWMEQNKKSLKPLGSRFMRWRTLRADASLEVLVTRIRSYYDPANNSDEAVKLRLAIAETAERFTERYCSEGESADGTRRDPITDPEKRAQVKAASVAYVEEELLYLIAYAIQYRIHYFIYPGPESGCPAFTVAREIFLTGADKDLLQWLEVKVRRAPEPDLSREPVTDIDESVPVADDGERRDSGSSSEDSSLLASDGVPVAGEFANRLFERLELVSREVSRQVSHEVSRQVSHEVSRQVSHEVSEQVSQRFAKLQRAVDEVHSMLAILTMSGQLPRVPSPTRSRGGASAMFYSPCHSAGDLRLPENTTRGVFKPQLSGTDRSLPSPLEADVATSQQQALSHHNPSP